jgi:putative ABC transport system permease protein
MNIFQSLPEALESLTANKARSALTMLGIIIGVAAVIAMMSIGAGAQNAITSQLESIGTNLLYVTRGGDVDNPRPLTLADAEAMADPSRTSTVTYVAPVVQSNVDVSVPGTSTSTQLVGVTPAYFHVQSITIAEGSTLTEQNLEDKATVALIGSDLAETLFDTTTGLVGKTVRIRGQIFRIIGVLKSEGGTGFGSQDNRILVPLTTAQQRVLRLDEPGEVDMIYVQAASAEQVDAAIDDVTQVLRARHRIRGGDDFQILSTEAMLETATEITGILTVFLGGIAGVSLLVGGIGIMNIMLVTVTERTREIGLRKALGARKRDVRLQFLVEALLLSLGGGIIGILTGWGISILIGKIAAAAGTNLDPAVTMTSVMLSTIFSAAIGLFFGLYPANRAARLQPVEALRSE